MKPFTFMRNLLLNNTGITLMEMAITLAVVGSLSAMAFPVSKPLLSRYKINSETRNLAGQLLWARLKAVSQQNNIIILFHTPNGNGQYTYELFSDDNDNGNRDQGEEQREFSLGKGIRFASDSSETSPTGETIQETDGVTFTSNRVIFTPQGSAIESGSIYLVFMDDVSSSINHDNGKALTIANTTGRIKVWKYCPGNQPIPWA